MKKIHLPFDEKCRHWGNWEFGDKEKFEWLKKYPQTLCWKPVEGLLVGDEKTANCKKCLEIRAIDKSVSSI